MSSLWLVTARPSMQLISKWPCFWIVYYRLTLGMLSHWHLNIASDYANNTTQKYRFSGVCRLDSKSSLGIEQWLSLIVWAVVLAYVAVQPTYQESNSCLAYGDMIGDKCPIHHFGHRKAGSKQALTQLHLHQIQAWSQRLIFCLVIQRAHISACYATRWCLRSHSPSWYIST